MLRSPVRARLHYHLCSVRQAVEGDSHTGAWCEPGTHTSVRAPAWECFARCPPAARVLGVGGRAVRFDSSARPGRATLTCHDEDIGGSVRASAGVRSRRLVCSEADAASTRAYSHPPWCSTVYCTLGAHGVTARGGAALSPPSIRITCSPARCQHGQHALPAQETRDLSQETCPHLRSARGENGDQHVSPVLRAAQCDAALLRSLLVH